MPAGICARTGVAGALAAAGLALVLASPASLVYAQDKLAGLAAVNGSDIDLPSSLQAVEPADNPKQQDDSYRRARISYRDASFGFSFIALLPRFEQKLAAAPRLVALLDKPWAAVGEERLDESRGGFDAGGLVMSFGIERAVYINGNLVTTTSFNVSDVGKISTDQMKTLSAQAAAMGLVQNGPGNSFQLTTGNSGLPGTVIQNTLNNQNIKSTTVINATTNSLNLIRGINTLDTFTNAVSGSLNGH
ncbi:hypothetical protein ACO0LO_02260 [Undibacterium sp. TJN25]|uniref:hypothetical protein n=1 Tax=Undibacterium sp. TJN25 TaxID=3413056 RepID=UPI003BF0857D